MLYQQRVMQELTTIAPHVAAWVLVRTPMRLHRQLLERTLNRVFKKHIAAGELDFLQNKTLKLLVKDLNLEFFLSYYNLQIKVRTQQVQADVFFAVTSEDLLLIATQQCDPDTLFFQRRLSVSGDTDVGVAIKNLLASVELLAHVPKILERFLQAYARTLIDARAI